MASVKETYSGKHLMRRSKRNNYKTKVRKHMALHFVVELLELVVVQRSVFHNSVRIFLLTADANGFVKLSDARVAETLRD